MWGLMWWLVVRNGPQGATETILMIGGWFGKRARSRRRVLMIGEGGYGSLESWLESCGG